MNAVATVKSLWRYPVKSMCGEPLDLALVGPHGFHGDRLYAIHDSSAPAHFPYLTARQKAEMLRYRPRIADWAHESIEHFARRGETRSSALMTVPRAARQTAATQSAVEVLSSEILPSEITDGEALPLSVQTPGGRCYAIDDPALLEELKEGLPERHSLSLMHSHRALTDAYPVSLFSIQTARQIGEDLAIPLDTRRFRANIYLDLCSDQGFGEDSFVGHPLRVGSEVVLAVVDRDPRCKMITLDPDTAEANPEVMKRVARAYESRAGVYATVLEPGTIRNGDLVYLAD